MALLSHSSSERTLPPQCDRTAPRRTNLANLMKFRHRTYWDLVSHKFERRFEPTSSPPLEPCVFAECCSAAAQLGRPSYAEAGTGVAEWISKAARNGSQKTKDVWQHLPQDAFEMISETISGWFRARISTREFLPTQKF